MTVYNPPLRDMRFVYHELLDGGSLAEIKAFNDFTPDVVDAVLEEAGRFTSEVLLPLNLSGDAEGCSLENGVVRTPNGFKDAYKKFIQGGWTGIAADTKYGGQGAPAALHFLIQEMICSTNMSFGMYPGLTEGAFNAINLHGSEEQKALYLPKFVEGIWSGTMCLTESQCGTDLGLIRTKANPQNDGSYKVTGTKIFISAGEHDLTENIVHLVLARLPGAPVGIKGISMFIVPKFIPVDDASIGRRNEVTCGSIEHKMGIKGSSTCVMNFENATGWLVGQPNKGMRAMFTMMNAARLGVGIQGLGIGEAAYQSCLAYAQERLQGRALNGAKTPDKPADSILVHPDIRKNLLTIKALTEGIRALCMWTAINLDKAEESDNAAERQTANDLLQLLTPIVKAYATDKGFQVANLGVQIYGGHGYIHEHGMEQFVRDARITQLYEGTNGIQALDLVGRKMGAHYGRYLRAFFHPVQNFIEDNTNDEVLQPFILGLAKAFGRLQQATGIIAQKGLSNPNEAGAAATDYLTLFGHVALAFMWAKTVKLALEKKDDDSSGFYVGKLKTARFFYERILPETGGLFSMIMAGSESIMDMDDALFDASTIA
ncbi:MAG: acyl-CoA dehydrogenase C-terminal domain-containing protein [Rhodospirillaceae bacterium]